jgi:hypothetical protein
MKIKFVPIKTTMHDNSTYIDLPVPATNLIPEWFKEMPQHMSGEKKDALFKFSNHATNTTVKACSPFLDGLSSGYIFTLPADVEVRRTTDEHNLKFRYRVNEEIISNHDPIQHPGMPVPENGQFSNVFKWSFPYRIITPKGYSMLFTHPLNRHDLPFRTFSGVVETDSYTLAVQFPFQFIKELEKGDSYIIKKGTPVVQMVPIKRDSWEREKIKPNENEIKKNTFEYFSTISRSYKKNFWQKKEYK